MRRKTHLLFLVGALALLVRAAGVDEFPPGLWFDEGLNGVDAWWTLHPGGPGGSGPRLVYPDVFPREPLLVWLLSVALWIGGPKVLAMRLVAILVGVAACVGFFDMVGVVSKRRGSAFALAAAFVLCTLHWHAHFSRLVFRTNLVPLLQVLAVAAVARAVAARTRRAWLGAGLVAGIGFYAYLSWYFFLPVILVWVWALQGDATDQDQAETGANEAAERGKGAPSLAWFAAGAAIVALPLLLHYIRFPEHLTGRPGEISPLRDGVGPALRLIARNARDVALMFSIRGDHVPKHNLPWAPALDVAWSVLFSIGVVDACARLRRPGPERRKRVAWLAWLGFMSLPSVLSQTDSANMLRNLGATPAVAYFVANGWWRGRALAAQLTAAPRSKWIQVALTALLVWGALFQVHRLWFRHPATEGIANEFSRTNVELAYLCLENAEGASTFVPTDFFTNKTFEFLTLERDDIVPLDPPTAMSKTDSGGEELDHRILCTMLSANYETLGRRFPQGEVEPVKLHQGNHVFAAVFRIRAADLLSPQEAAVAAQEMGLSAAR